jgi:hypothetical protein
MVITHYECYTPRRQIHHSIINAGYHHTVSHTFDITLTAIDFEKKEKRLHNYMPGIRGFTNDMTQRNGKINKKEAYKRNKEITGQREIC